MKKQNKKSQISLEFLITYGWVIIVVLAAIAVLANYGFLNPNKYLPERVEFNEQLNCEEYFMDTDAMGDDLVALKLRNNFARPISISNLYAKSGNNYQDCGITTAGDISIGEAVILACNNTELSDNVKNDVNFIITFSRNVTGAPEHNISGLIFAQPVEGEYCTQKLNNGSLVHNYDHLLGSCQ